MQKFSTKYRQTKFNSTLKRSYIMTEWDSSLGGKGRLNTHQSINVIHHITRIKEKIHTIISNDAENSFGKI